MRDVGTTRKNTVPPKNIKQARARRIGLLGNFGTQNLGNEGSLEAMLRFLARAKPDAEITCICRYPENVHANFGVASLPLSLPRLKSTWAERLNRLLLKAPRRIVDLVSTFRALRRLDLILVPGTGILDDFGERPRDMPLALFKWCLAARLAQRPVAFVSIGAGPIRNELSKRLMRYAAKTARYRSYRDTVSKDFMKSLGVDTACDPVYPDLVFSLPVARIESGKRGNGDPLTVGVGVMNYAGWSHGSPDGGKIREEYVAKITTFVLWLLQVGYRVRLLIGNQSDCAAVKDIAARASIVFPHCLEESLLAEPAHSLDELMRQIGSTDVVVATRFHNIVCALMAAKPVISLGYATKNEVLLREMGLGDYCQETENIDSALLIRQFEKLIREREQLGVRIRDTIRFYEKRLLRQEARLLEEIIG